MIFVALNCRHFFSLTDLYASWVSFPASYSTSRIPIPRTEKEKGASVTSGQIWTAPCYDLRSASGAIRSRRQCAESEQWTFPPTLRKIAPYCKSRQEVVFSVCFGVDTPRFLCRLRRAYGNVECCVVHEMGGAWRWLSLGVFFLVPNPSFRKGLIVAYGHCYGR